MGGARSAAGLCQRKKSIVVRDRDGGRVLLATERSTLGLLFLLILQEDSPTKDREHEHAVPCSDYVEIHTGVP